MTATFGAALAGALPRLRRYAIALAGDVATADDLLQDCMERAWKSQAAITDEGALFPWLRAILHNVNIDRIRLRRLRYGAESAAKPDAQGRASGLCRPRRLAVSACRDPG